MPWLALLGTVAAGCVLPLLAGSPSAAAPTVKPGPSVSPTAKPHGRPRSPSPTPAPTATPTPAATSSPTVSPTSRATAGPTATRPPSASGAPTGTRPATAAPGSAPATATTAGGPGAGPTGPSSHAVVGELPASATGTPSPSPAAAPAEPSISAFQGAPAVARRIAVVATKDVQLPLGILLVVALFLLVQNRIDRRDPKLVRAWADFPEELDFDPPTTGRPAPGGP